MSRQKGLVHLGLSNQDWGPCYHDNFTYEQFAAKWRGTVPSPTEAELTQAIIDYDAVQAARDLKEEAFNTFNDQGLNILKAFILCLNDGSFVPGTNYTSAQVKAKIKAKM